MSNGAGSHVEKVDRLYKDVYYGNGKPGLCTRMEVTEGDVEAIGKRLDNFDKKFWALILLALTILGTSIADLVKSNEHPQTQQMHSFNE